jgi:Concanavalin A-like lectin/glucanases superfamily/EGF-like domain/Somatomedin B domain
MIGTATTSVGTAILQESFPRPRRRPSRTGYRSLAGPGAAAVLSFQQRIATDNGVTTVTVIVAFLLKLALILTLIPNNNSNNNNNNVNDIFCSHSVCGPTIFGTAAAAVTVTVPVSVTGKQVLDDHTVPAAAADPSCSYSSSSDCLSQSSITLSLNQPQLQQLQLSKTYEPSTVTAPGAPAPGPGPQAGRNGIVIHTMSLSNTIDTVSRTDLSSPPGPGAVTVAPTLTATLRQSLSTSSLSLGPGTRPDSVFELSETPNTNCSLGGSIRCNTTYASGCQCHVGCIATGDCCPDFEATCEQQNVLTCPSGTWNDGAIAVNTDHYLMFDNALGSKGNFTLTKDFTIAFWVYPVALGTNKSNTFFSMGYNSSEIGAVLSLGFNKNDRIQAIISGVGAFIWDVDMSGDNHKWMHLVFVYDYDQSASHKKLSIYRNGVLGYNVTGFDGFVGTGPVYIGHSIDHNLAANADANAIGLVDDVRIFSKTLDPNSIVNAYLNNTWSRWKQIDQWSFKGQAGAVAKSQRGKNSFRAESSDGQDILWVSKKLAGLCFMNPCTAATANPCENGAGCTVLTYSGTPKCHCLNGFLGTTCIEIDDCWPDPCLNGAKCTDLLNDYSCSCTAGYSGKNCSVNIDECSPDPCEHGATCTDLVNDYSCSCTAGYSGKNCSVNIDECSPDPCEHGATCTDLVNDYSCNCSAQWKGKNCTQPTIIDYCASNPCQNSGNCTSLTAGYSCACTQSWYGTNCTTPINHCEGILCHNQGTCIPSDESYSCHCPTGYTGTHCELSVDDCADNPCHNGGSCIDQHLGYICSCAVGWTGPNCTVNIDDCASVPCQHGGACTDLVNDYECACTAGYIGKNCESETNECNPNPCSNGQCTDLFLNYSCACNAGWEGRDCDMVIDVCKTNPLYCNNNSTCIASSHPVGSKVPTCDCNTGWAGDQCTHVFVDCSQEYCQNSVSCTEPNLALLESYPSCTCKMGWTGVICSIDVDECVTLSDTGCSPLTSCINRPGGRECSACPAGYHRQSDPNVVSGYLDRVSCVRVIIECTANSTSEHGTSIGCIARLEAAPSSEVLIELQSSDLSEMQIQLPGVSRLYDRDYISHDAMTGSVTVRFTPTNWQDSVTAPANGQLATRRFDVVGVRDNILDGDKISCLIASDPTVTAGVLGSNRLQAFEYRGYSDSCAIAITNKHINFPQITKVTPTVSPLLGIVVTIEGTMFYDGINATIGGRQSVNLTIISAHKMEFVTPVAPNVSENSPLSWADSYRDLHMRNTDGGDVACPPACEAEHNIYYVDECVPSGQWGSGFHCTPCPPGAVCPGGYRIWPQEGYWIPTERSPPAMLHKCSLPDERCSGGRLSTCGVGYTGPFCSDCDIGYFKDSGGLCLSCRADNALEDIRWVITFGGVVIAGVFAVILFATDGTLHIVVTVLGVVQQLVSMIASSTAMLPPWMQNVYFYLRSLLFDFNFVRPGCEVSTLPFASVYLIVVTWVVGFGIMAIAMAILYQFRFARSCSEPWILHPRKPRLYNGIIIAFHLTYIEVCIMTFRVLDCTDVQTQSATVDINGDIVSHTSQRLFSDLTQVCYSDRHLLAGIIGWCVLLLYIIGIPLWTASSLHKGWRNGKLATAKYFGYFGYMYRNLQLRYYWFDIFSEYLVSFAIVAATVFFRSDITSTLAVMVSMYCVSLTLHTVLQEGRTYRQNMSRLQLGAGRTIVASFAAFYFSSSVDDIALPILAGIGFAVAFICVVLCLTVYKADSAGVDYVVIDTRVSIIDTRVSQADAGVAAAAGLNIVKDPVPKHAICDSRSHNHCGAVEDVESGMKKVQYMGWMKHGKDNCDSDSERDTVSFASDATVTERDFTDEAGYDSIGGIRNSATECGVAVTRSGVSESQSDATTHPGVSQSSQSRITPLIRIQVQRPELHSSLGLSPPSPLSPPPPATVTIQNYRHHSTAETEPKRRSNFDRQSRQCHNTQKFKKRHSTPNTSLRDDSKRTVQRPPRRISMPTMAAVAYMQSTKHVSADILALIEDAVADNTSDSQRQMKLRSRAAARRKSSICISPSGPGSDSESEHLVPDSGLSDNHGSRVGSRGTSIMMESVMSQHLMVPQSVSSSSGSDFGSASDSMSDHCGSEPQFTQQSVPIVLPIPSTASMSCSDPISLNRLDGPVTTVTTESESESDDDHRKPPYQFNLERIPEATHDDDSSEDDKNLNQMLLQDNMASANAAAARRSLNSIIARQSQSRRSGQSLHRRAGLQNATSDSKFNDSQTDRPTVSLSESQSKHLNQIPSDSGTTTLRPLESISQSLTHSSATRRIGSASTRSERLKSLMQRQRPSNK